MLQAPKAAVGEPINTTVDMSPLVHAACKREDERFLADADDAEAPVACNIVNNVSAIPIRPVCIMPITF